MAVRDDLIQRKEAIIGELRAAQRRLAHLRQRNPVSAQPTLSSLEGKIQRLQAEERRLRLAIDRTQSLPKAHLHPSQKTMQTHFDVLITAGYDRDKPEFLVPGEPQKAWVEIAGAPMIWHVVRSLDESDLIDRIVIVGLEERGNIDFGRSVHRVADQGSMMANQRAGGEQLVALDPQNRMVLALGADAPLITGEMVRWFIRACRPFDRDVYWGVVRKEVMEATFPESRRSYIRLREGRFCSGDLFLFDLNVGLRIHDRLEDFVANRKSIPRQLRLLGVGSVVRFIFGRLSVQGLLDVVNRYLQADGSPIFVPFAEVGMDVDKPRQLAQVHAYLEEHPEHPANQRGATANQETDAT